MSTFDVRDFVGAVYDGVEGFVNVRTLPAPVEQAFVPVADVDAHETFVGHRDARVPNGPQTVPETVLPADVADAIVSALTEAILASFRRDPLVTVGPAAGTDSDHDTGEAAA